MLSNVPDLCVGTTILGDELIMWILPSTAVRLDQ